MATRDEFSSNVMIVLRERVGGFCSNPNCRCTTTGPNDAVLKSTRVGVCAHICAASPRGPRYDATMTQAERTSPSNGIWLCATCARRIDVDSHKFPQELLYEWKRQAEEEADRNLGKPRSMCSDNCAEEPALPFVCPHCHTGFALEQTICRGCHGQIVAGATQDERKAAAMTGAMLVILPLLFIYGKFDVKLFHMDGDFLNNIPLYFLAISGFFSAYQAVAFMEKYRRKNNPRVFVRTFV